ncbi:hypothetical protein D3C72_1349240 [compost metagenome]
MSAAPSLAGTRLMTIETMKDSAYSDPAVQRYWKRCEEIARMKSFAGQDGAVTPPVIELTPGAENGWLKFYNRVEIEQGSLGEYGGPLKPFASRSGELARRVAAVFALFECEQQISEQTMKAACEIVEHSLQEWARYLGHHAAESNNNREALELLGWLQARPAIRSVTGILKGGPRKFRSTAKARGALHTLTAAGWLAFPAGDKQEFEINPHKPTDEVANVATPAKSCVIPVAVIGESMANGGETATTQDHVARLDQEIRHDSPLPRHGENQLNRTLSPDSPNSPPPTPVDDSGQWCMTI